MTDILTGIERGEAQAAEALLPLIYDELRALALAKLAHERPGQTLDATSLVHEAYLRLMDGVTPRKWDHRGHFFAAAAEAMRRILIERARRRQREKHGGGRAREDVDLLAVPELDTDDDLLALDAALERLADRHPQAAELVQLRYFAGVPLNQVADLLGISPRTANRLWAYARAFLHSEIYKH